jgi:hypothetical protein
MKKIKISVIEDQIYYQDEIRYLFKNDSEVDVSFFFNPNEYIEQTSLTKILGTDLIIVDYDYHQYTVFDVSFSDYIKSKNFKGKTVLISLFSESFFDKSKLGEFDGFISKENISRKEFQKFFPQAVEIYAGNSR